MLTIQRGEEFFVATRELDLDDGDVLIRVGAWYWFRRAHDGELREVILPDWIFGPADEVEVMALLRDEREGRG